MTDFPIMTAEELVTKLATFTDPRDTEEPAEELEAFAWCIRKAKQIVGDLSPTREELEG